MPMLLWIALWSSLLGNEWLAGDGIARPLVGKRPA
jgi:hypothetical protein